MFGNGENSSNGGCTPHRFPHHMDPGIPLFNYEDHEGWYLYDPTCIPYYRVYDDKPTIVNVDYVIYTRSKITSWRIDFGCRGIYNDGSGDKRKDHILYAVRLTHLRNIILMLAMAGIEQSSASKPPRANTKKI